MPCFRPLKGYRAARVNPDTGKRGIVFNAHHGNGDMPIDLPCGRCIGCRLERSRQWAIRCVHEASTHNQNCFITLTYSPENLPANNTLVKKDFQDFMKRFRFHYGTGIRFFHCGEYGEKNDRPHYHACIFNFNFDDRKLAPIKQNPEFPLDVSEKLTDLWGKGFATVGNVTFESAAYVARYITKKITGDRAADHYGSRLPEYTTMSRRPGIGKIWYQRYTSDIFPHDRIVIRGKEMNPPKYYNRLFELDSPNSFASVKIIRKQKAVFFSQAEPETRLAVKEEIQQLRFLQLKRGYENVT